MNKIDPPAPLSPLPRSGRRLGWKGIALGLLLGALFVGSIYAVFILNSRLVREQADHEQVAVTATRVRSTASRIYAYLGALELKRRDKADFAALLQSLDRTQNRLDSIVRSLAEGGTVKEVNGGETRIRPLPTAAGKALTRQLQELWEPLRRNLLTLTDANNEINPKALDAAIRQISADDATYIKLSDGIFKEENQSAQSTLGALALYRNLCAGLVALFPTLLLPLGLLVARVNRANNNLAATSQELAAAKQDTDLILSTVRQGMLLMTQDGAISGQHSAAMKEIFHTEHLAGFNFLHILQRILSEKIFLTTRDYFAMLFDPSKKEKLLNKINPLARVEANFSRPEGGFHTKYLEFSFSRILNADGKSVDRAFVAVRDITQQVELEERLKQSEQRKERQFELLLGILHVGPDALKEFLSLADEELKQINQTLRAEDFIVAAGGARQTAALRERLDVVFRAVHNIKGNADYLKLEHFSKAAHTFEDTISDLKNRSRLAGDDFLAITIHQAELRNDLAEVRDLGEKLTGLRHGLVVPAPVADEPPAAPRDAAGASRAAGGGEGGGLFEGVRSLAGTLAARLGKEVTVQATELNGSTPPEALRGIMRDILIQLTRNSLVHGVETPAERQAQGKARCATLSIGPAADPAVGYPFGFVFRDDGRGLDPATIRRRAVERGLITPQAAAAMSDPEAAMLIFEPGFSTAQTVTGDAGRGVGLDIVKARVIDELGGDVMIDSEPGKFCEFTFLLPAAVPAAGWPRA